MARARKLFPIYGSALANRMLVALGRGRMVGVFVADYVSEYDRRGIMGDPLRDRELAETIGREVVLAMILEARQSLPRFFGKKQIAKLKEDERQAIEAFFHELIAALDRALKWSMEDRLQFGSDLTLYSDFEAAQAALAKTRKQGKAREEELPFIGRVALLLDPSMLEQARRASRKFHGDVVRLAQKLLRQTLGPSR
jgi:hypothetical protein